MLRSECTDGLCSTLPILLDAKMIWLLTEREWGRFSQELIVCMLPLWSWGAVSWWRLLLTYCVPFCVATFGAYSAYRAADAS